jgi:hypothetical protein
MQRLRCAGFLRPRPATSGSRLSLSFLPDMPPSTTPGRSGIGLFQSCDPDIGLRHLINGSALPAILQSASRRADISGLPGSPLLRPVKLLTPCADLTRSPGHRGFYLQASDESVALLIAGYNYDSHWIALSMGLSPIGMTASLAAR